jgi:CMP-N-acetylneuraminic acid synthetase
MKNTIAIIPARGGSKRLPAKNIKLLAGMPLIAHSILYAKANAKWIEDIYVTTDDNQIKDIALAFGAKVIDRPAEISGDFEPTVSALRHVLENIEPVENVVLLQPTNPLRPENLFADAFENFQNGHYDSLFTVTRNHQKFGRIIADKFVPFNYEIGQRSQDLEPIYFENGLLYLTKSAFIMQNTIIGDRHFPFVVDHVFSDVDIDTAEDFAYANYLLEQFKNQKIRS